MEMAFKGTVGGRGAQVHFPAGIQAACARMGLSGDGAVRRFQNSSFDERTASNPQNEPN